MIILPPGIGRWRITEARLAMSAKRAATAQASSHHIEAIDHLHQSLNKVESIAKPSRDPATTMTGLETVLDQAKNSPVVQPHVISIRACGVPTSVATWDDLQRPVMSRYTFVPCGMCTCLMTLIAMPWEPRCYTDRVRTA